MICDDNIVAVKWFFALTVNDRSWDDCTCTWKCSKHFLFDQPDNLLTEGKSKGSVHIYNSSLTKKESFCITYSKSISATDLPPQMSTLLKR